ncbi:MAG: hypothetical protein ACYTGL_30730 [Planctomycetota bacterium]|jgi:hypothetical protein
MPLSKLYVEGKLDSEIYTPVFAGAVTIEKGGSKNSLRPQAGRDRQSGIQAGYLRDRDFDFDPPDDMESPTADSLGDEVWGWRLNRHEIENYLIDSRVVEAKFGIEANLWQDWLREAGMKICWYQVARWTVGYARSQLPPHYKLQTSPGTVAEMRLPADLSEEASLTWCRSTIEAFHTRIDECLGESAVAAHIQSRAEHFSEERLGDPLHILTWCSGKDLFAALPDDALQVTLVESPATLCNILRDWVRDHPEEFVDFFPEFAALKQHMISVSS